MAVIFDRIKGSITALITPFKNGELDEQAFKRLVDWQIAEGTHGLVPVGTTGESPTLSHKEHMRVVELCVDTARGRVPVIAGAGSNSTREAIELTRHAKDIGAEPLFGRPTITSRPRTGSPALARSRKPLICRSSSTTSGRSISDLVETMANWKHSQHRWRQGCDLQPRPRQPR
jgi:hypothetical protein